MSYNKAYGVETNPIISFIIGLCAKLDMLRFVKSRMLQTFMQFYKMNLSSIGFFFLFAGKVFYRTRAKSSYGTCDEARRAKSQEVIWYEL